MKLMLILTLTITLGIFSNAEEVIDKRKEARSGWYGSRYNGYLDSDENYGYGSFIKGNSNFGYLDDSREDPPIHLILDLGIPLLIPDLSLRRTPGLLIRRIIDLHIPLTIAPDSLHLTLIDPPTGYLVKSL
ncbi:hypothetical protein Anas_04716 [Armadillidium nasatum]|uniref:Uncharacterized protein n=1 Tax=Armadillidium nasatum TaxID=96803 RepID=A0A5N5TL15_9CRUS|nr:hypothetical protein Anas_04716 [Armadillidium nasatum]